MIFSYGVTMNKIRFSIRLLFAASFIMTSNVFGQWTQSKGLENSTVTSFTSIGNNLLAGVEGGYVYLSKDSGATWTSIDTLASAQYCPNCTLVFVPSITIYTDGTNVFAGSAADSGSVHISTDSGLTWKEYDPSFVQNINCFTSLGGILFAGTDDGVFRSNNYGITWFPSNNGLSFGNYDSTYNHAPQVTRLAVKGNDLFAGTSGEGLFFSADSAANWIQIDSGLTNLEIYGLSVIDSYIFAGAFKFPGNSTGGVYVSANNGTTWNQSNSGLTNYMLNVLYAKDSLLFAGTNEGVFVSNNKGFSWNIVGNKTSVSFALFAFGPYLLSNGSGGVWRYPLSQLVTNVANRSNHTPNSFYLNQNFPNPFNPTTIITYSLPVSSDVTLKIYDVLGRKITTLVDKFQTPGIHTVTYNAAALSSGIYLYKLTAGSFSQTKKLILIK